MTRPNLLLITSDQHRADTLGCKGHLVRTPHLDRLSFQGVRFDNAYVDCPVSIPARTTLITGRRAHENGMPAYSESFRITRSRDDFLGSLVTSAGYQTELSGWARTRCTARSRRRTASTTATAS
jgi:arylsulfatase A-like enzyme